MKNSSTLGRISLTVFASLFSFCTSQSQNIDFSGHWVTFNNFGIPTGNVYSILEEDGGGYWAGMDGALYYFNFHDSLQIINSTNSNLPNGKIMSLAKDNNGDLWMCIPGKGLIKMDNDSSFVVYNTMNSSIPSEGINDIEIDNNNVIYMASTDGLIKYDIGIGTFSHSMSSNSFGEVELDPSGAVWLGDPYLYKYISQTNYTPYYSPQDPLPSNYFECMEVDIDGNVWIGTTNGLARLNDTTWTIWNTSSGLLSNHVQAIDVFSAYAIYLITGLGVQMSYTASINWESFQNGQSPFCFQGKQELALIADTNSLLDYSLLIAGSPPQLFSQPDTSDLPYQETFDDHMYLTDWSNFETDITGSSTWYHSQSNLADGASAPEIILDGGGNGSFWLISPCINTTGMDSLQLSFVQDMSAGTGSYVRKVMSTSDDSVWTDIISNVTSSNTSYTAKVKNADVGSSCFRLAFYFDGYLTTFGYWAIDDILLEEHPGNIGLDENKLKQVTLYPNPSNGHFQIEASQAIESIEIREVDGRLVSMERIENGSLNARLHIHHSGIYVVRIHFRDSTHVQKVMVH